MGDSGQPVDDTAAKTTKKTGEPTDTTATKGADATTKTPEVNTSGDSTLSPIAQIAVDNQGGALPGAKSPEKAPANGQIEITPLPVGGEQAAVQPGAKPGTDKPQGAPAEAVNAPEKKEEPRTRANELTDIPPATSFQDGRSDNIDLIVKRVSLLPKDDKARQLILRELADSFENGKTYPERLQSAKALITLTRGSDGKVPDKLVDRDVLIPETGHKTQAFRNSPSKYVIDTPARHELKALTGATVLNFLNNSAETIEQQTKALKDKPVDDKDRHNLVQKLTALFQTSQDDTPEKLAAAKGLLDLNRKADGSYPDVLGTRDIEIAKVTGKNRQNREYTISEARTDHVNTTRSDVENYLANRSERLIADTAKIANPQPRAEVQSGSEAKPDADAQLRADLSRRAINVFLQDSANPENKTAAAVALLEINKGEGGVIPDTLGSRTIHHDAKTQTITPQRGGKSTVKEVAPAYDEVNTVTKADAVKFLETQLDSAVVPRSRLMAADALKGAGLINEERYKEVVKGIIADDRAPESLKTQLQKLTGVDQQQEVLKQQSDGRVIAAKPEDFVSLNTAQGGQRDRLQLVLERLALNPDLKSQVTDKQIDDMKKELADGKFGPASRDFYNKSVTYMNNMATGLAIQITSRNGTLPEGLPITVPKDDSGRAIGDDLFRAQLLTGRLAMDLKTVKPGEVPNGDRLTDTALWNVKAYKEFDNMHLKWEVAVFDDRLQAFNKDGKLDAWKSTENMSIDDMRKLQSSRGEWLQLGMQVRNYAHAIHYFNRSTTEASNIPRLSFSGAEFSTFSDEALSDKNFPGKIVRDDKKIISIEIDLPKTLDRHDPENLAKVAKLQAWLEKYGPKVDQVTEEIKKATIDSGRLLVWQDVDQEGVDEATGKKFNFVSMRFSADTVKVKLPDGSEEERIRVVNSKQRRYAGDFSAYKTVGDITDVGDPITSGEVKVNGKVVSLDAGENGVTLGSTGDIKVAGDAVDAQHARMRVDTDGRIFIKDNGSKAGTYVAGEKIDSSKWVEVFPEQTVTLGKPPASLSIGRTEKGEVTFNGQTLKIGEPAKIGSSCAINVTGDGVSSEHALVKVDAQGKIYIKDNGSEKGTYVNGKAVNAKDWTQISDSDSVTFGPPAAQLDIQADVRLYKKGDMVSVVMDGQMQLMPAENLSSWGTEAAAWHYTGKGAMAALDLGMLISGGVALKGVEFAAAQGLKEAGTLGAKAVVTKMVTTPGFARAAWHLGLGATGILHQSIENTGPYGKKLMEYRGYAMMADIFYGSFVKDGAAVARKAFGMAAPAESGSALSGYLKTAPWANRLNTITDRMFLGMNAYFIPEIAAHQMPAIFTSLRKHDAGRLLQAGVLLRDEKYQGQGKDNAAPPATLEDQARRFATPETRDKITQAKLEASEKAALPADQKKEKQAYLEELSNRFLDSPNADEKLAAAFGLLQYHAASGDSLPEVLGTRWKTQNDIPDNVTATQVKAFIDSKIPTAINFHDKALQAKVEANFGDVAKVASKPQDDAERKALNDKMILDFANGKDENTRVAAAMGLMLLNENGGKVPDTVGITKGADGADIEVTAADIRDQLSRYQSNALVSRFDSYASSMKGNPKAEAILGRTRELLENDDSSEARKAELSNLMSTFESKNSDRDEKAAAALALLFLNTDKTTGALPAKLADTSYQVGVDRLVQGTVTGTPATQGLASTIPQFNQTDKKISSIPGSLSPQSSANTALTGGLSNAPGGRVALSTVRQVNTRSLETADVLQYLKGNMPTFAPGTRLAVGDLLYRAGEAPMAGRSPFNDLGGVLLSVVEDKNAPPEARRQALLNAHGLGLADVMEIHRFNTEPGITKLVDGERTSAEADIYGRDSKAMEKALLDIVAQPDSDKDLRALASATLMANSEGDPDKRKAMLSQMQTEYDAVKATPGTYYNQVFQREGDTLRSMFKNGEFVANNDADRSKLYRSAIILSKTGNWKEFGITDAQIAQALETAFVPQQPIVAQHALDPLLSHYKDLDATGRELVELNMINLIGESQGAANSPGYLLRLDVLNRLGEIGTVVGPQFMNDARKTITSVLTPGTVQNRGADENVRAAAIRALGQIGSNDQATQDLLKRVVGAGSEKADPSALVRSAALDRLAALKPFDMNQIAAKLLVRETDPEVLRKIGALELSTRRLDPDSAEYKERFRQAYSRLMEAGANKYSLAEVPDFIRKNYPMLEWETLWNTAAKRANENEGTSRWAWQKHADLDNPYFEAAKAEMSGQLEAIINKAARPEGDMERRTLAWIVMSNGKFMDESTRADAVDRAAWGLYNAAHTGDAKTRQEVAPLILMAVATQDRMPFASRSKLVDGLTWLYPGSPGSPVSREDAGIAVLAGLKRQFERTPRDGNDPAYKDSHELQMKMLDIYSRYMGTEAIPTLEAMVASQTKFALGRDNSGRVKDVTYPDQSKRSVDYNPNNEIWRMSLATKSGAAQTLIRNGNSNEWYDESDSAKKTVWRGTASYDQATGNFQTLDSFGKGIVYTPDGGKVERSGNQVTKVTYPDNSSRELVGNKETFIDANGGKQVWFREGNSNTWYQDTDSQKKSGWTGTSGFDADGNYAKQQQGQQKEVIRADGSHIYYQGDQPVLSTPGAADNSAHPMPMVRDKAQELLGKLRDGTGVLQRDAKLDSASTTQELADNLKKVLQNREANSEVIVNAIFSAGLSKPITEADDPRRDVLRGLLSDPNERIRLAAAQVLFKGSPAPSPAQESVERNRLVARQDRELAAGVIADMFKNGSRQGYREDAGRLIDSVKPQKPSDAPSEDSQLLQAALQNAKSERRIDLANPNANRTIDQQEKYEQATGAMIRDTQISLDAISKPEWWQSHGYNLLEASNWTKASYENADSVSFNMWEKLVNIFDSDPAQAKFQSALDNLNKERGDQLNKLIDKAQLNDLSDDAMVARKALAFVVLTNGYPLAPELRDTATTKAAETLARIYKKGGPGADFAEQIVTAALIANPGIRRDVRETFVDAVYDRLANDQTTRGNASNTKAAILLSAALEAEHLAMPQSGQPGNYASLNLQRKILNKLDSLDEGISMPVLEAMAKAHPDPYTKEHAARIYGRLKDATEYLLSSTEADTTTSPAQKAQTLKDLFAGKGSPKAEDDTVREIFRLAHPRTLLKDDPTTASDPRLDALRTGLTNSNERIRVAAARVLASAGDPRGIIALSELQDSGREGVRREAGDLYRSASRMASTVKQNADGEAYLRQSLESKSDRTRIAAAHTILAQRPGDAAASAVLADTYASRNQEVKAEAKELIIESNNSPIEKPNDPRRPLLEKQLASSNESTQMAAAWMLSHSKVEGDFEKAATVIARLALKNDTRADAQSLLKDIIAYGSDKQQEFALANWNAAWKAANSPASDKPPSPTEIDQARKFYRLASSADKRQLFTLPESEKKALIMHMSGMSEAQLEQILQPAPTADVIAPRRDNPFDPFNTFGNRSDLLFPLPGTDSWSGTQPLLAPLSARWQPAGSTRWNQAIASPGGYAIPSFDGAPAQPYYRAGTAGNGGQGTRAIPTLLNLGDKSAPSPYIRVDADGAPALIGVNNLGKGTRLDAKDSSALARLSIANMLQDQSRSGAVLHIGKDGKIALQVDGDRTAPAGSRPVFVLPGADGDDAIKFGAGAKTPPEFSDFLDYLATQRPDVLQQPTIKSSELSVMFLQYLRQREAGLKTGYMITPSLYDKNIEVLTSDPRAVPWYSETVDRKGNSPRAWNDVQKEREKLRSAKLDGEIVRLLASQTPNGNGPHWKPDQPSAVAKPEFLSKPPVELLEANRFDVMNVLPADLLGRRRLVLPGTDIGGTLPVDVEIPTSRLNAEIWRARQDALNGDRLAVLRSPSDPSQPRLTSYQLSPAAQEILRRYRVIRLQGDIATLNSTVKP